MPRRPYHSGTLSARYLPKANAPGSRISSYRAASPAGATLVAFLGEAAALRGRVAAFRAAVDAEDGSEVESAEVLAASAALLRVDAEALARSMTKRKIVMRGETLVADVSREKALGAADALAKGAYMRLFNWIVQRINLSSACAEGVRVAGAVNLLDIFGFEIFLVNSFEQLCINFCNEKLQLFFNQHVFEKEKEAYM